MKSHRWFDSSVDDCEIVNRIVLFVSYLLLLTFRVLPASENTHYTHIRIFRGPPNHSFSLPPRPPVNATVLWTTAIRRSTRDTPHASFVSLFPKLARSRLVWWVLLAIRVTDIPGLGTSMVHVRRTTSHRLGALGVPRGR
jgi:hypothetical protein